MCYSCDVPEAVVDHWGFRRQYIGQGELLAGPLALHVFGKELRDESAIWFIGNQSALPAMIKGASPVQDNCQLAVVLALQLCQHNTKAWFEYVDSKANPSDGLSREGFDDVEVQRQLSSGNWIKAHCASLEKVELLTATRARIEKQLTALGSS